MLGHKKPTVCTACGGPVSWTWRNGSIGYAHLLPSDHGAMITPPESNVGTDMGPLFLTPRFSGNFSYRLTQNIPLNPLSGPVRPAGAGWTVPGISGLQGPNPMSTSKTKQDVGR